MSSSKWTILLVFISLAALQLPHAHGHGRGNIELLQGNSIGSGMGNDACDYHYEVKTGEMNGAGTDSDVRIEISRSDHVGFDTTFAGTSSSGAAPFEQGQTDTLHVNNWCMHPCRLRITTDGAGIMPDWYVEWVKVTVSGQLSHQHTFKVYNWIVPEGEDYGVYENPIIDDC